MSIDVWYSDGENLTDKRHSEEVASIREGKAIMRKMLKAGNCDIVMYVRTDKSEDNRQYFFSNGKIIFDKDGY